MKSFLVTEQNALRTLHLEKEAMLPVEQARQKQMANPEELSERLDLEDLGGHADRWGLRSADAKGEPRLRPSLSRNGAEERIPTGIGGEVEQHLPDRLRGGFDLDLRLHDPVAPHGFFPMGPSPALPPMFGLLLVPDRWPAQNAHRGITPDLQKLRGRAEKGESEFGRRHSPVSIAAILSRGDPRWRRRRRNGSTGEAPLCHSRSRRRG